MSLFGLIFFFSHSQFFTSSFQKVKTGKKKKKNNFFKLIFVSCQMSVWLYYNNCRVSEILNRIFISLEQSKTHQRVFHRQNPITRKNPILKTHRKNQSPAMSGGKQSQAAASPTFFSLRGSLLTLAILSLISFICFSFKSLHFPF